MTRKRALGLALMALNDVADRYRGECPQDWTRAARLIREMLQQERLQEHVLGVVHYDESPG